ncbi:uncharacterized protein LOC105846455 isoform X2 [Hydra vulgaris]|uniref:uncharacterized protein LOC105846455 isoform X2 n=1 Tax=Hydra vulgaris TaxID=6087 RepID=UPI000640BB4D|nr:uncharacterized protein LOC105846455 isoform X2 [Hydra vulgaris]
MVLSTTTPKLVRKPKVTNNLIVIIIAVTVILIFIFVTVLLVVRKRRLKRKSLVLLARFQREASQIQLINQGSLQSSIYFVRNFDDSAYVDPSICSKKRYETKTANDPNVLRKVSNSINNIDPHKKNTNNPDYVEPNVHLNNESNEKKNPNYEYPLVSQLTIKKKPENNEYESCGQVQSSNHEYVDIIGGTGEKFHYYTDPEVALQSYKKKKQSEYTKTDSKNSNEATNTGYAKLLVSERPLSVDVNKTIESDNKIESKSQYTSLELGSHVVLNDSNSNAVHGNSTVYPAGYARLFLVNSKTSTDVSPNYFQLEPDAIDETTLEEIAI